MRDLSSRSHCAPTLRDDGWRHAQLLEAPLGGAGTYFPEDPSWFGPSSERTVVGAGDGTESTHTRLPPPSDDDE